MGRSPCCSKEGLNRGAWTAMEDKLLIDFIKLHGEGKWRNLPKRAGLKRCGKSCRLRWLNYLRPDIKRGNISADEEDLIIRLHNLLGNRWSLIAGRLPGRTDNEIKNYWNTNIGKRIQASPKNDVSNVKTTCRLLPSPKPATTQTTTTTTTTAAVEPHQSTVFRTKATRCTKVLLFPPEKLNQAPPAVTPDPKPVILSDMVVSPALDHDQRSSMLPILPADDDDDHENFLSELLSIDGECFQQFSDCFHVEENGQSSIINGGGDNILFNDEDVGHVIEPDPFNQSPETDIDRSDDHHHHHHRDQANNFLFPENMASLNEPDLDWLFQD